MLSAASPLTVGIVASIATKERLESRVLSEGVFFYIIPSLSKNESLRKARPLTRMSRVQKPSILYINTYLFLSVFTLILIVVTEPCQRCPCLRVVWPWEKCTGSIVSQCKPHILSQSLANRDVNFRDSIWLSARSASSRSSSNKLNSAISLDL